MHTYKYNHIISVYTYTPYIPSHIFTCHTLLRMHSHCISTIHYLPSAVTGIAVSTSGTNGIYNAL